MVRFMYETSSIVAAAVCGGASIVIPIAAAVIFKAKNKDVPFSPFFVGAGAFILFALILEQLMHSIMLPVVSGSPVLYVIYGSLAAGIFEETGRLCAYKTLMKNQKDPRVSLLYGIGHGGCEAVMIAGLTLISLAVTMYMANSMGYENLIAMSSGGNEQTAQTLRIQMEQLVGYGFGNGAVVVFERLVTMVFHISMSVIMFRAARGKILLYPVCVLAHAIVDVPAVMYQLGKVSLPVTYVFMCIMTIVAVLFAVRVYRRMKAEQMSAGDDTV